MQSLLRTDTPIPTKDAILIDVNAVANFQIASETMTVDENGKQVKALENAAKNYLNQSKERMEKDVTQVLLGKLREVIGKTELKELMENRDTFAATVAESAREERGGESTGRTGAEANRRTMWGAVMTGDRLPAFFLKGVWQGLKIALIPHARLRDPLGPMPTVRDWLDMYGGTRMDADMFDRCESEWYALLEQRKRRMSAFLAGGYAGTWMYAIGVLVLLGLVGWRIWQLIP